MADSDETLYAKAVLFRDQKVEGYSADESSQKASEMFFELSNRGNTKAMHNYASIQYKKENYGIAFEYFTKAGLVASKINCDKMVKQGLVKRTINLVVGSDRSPPNFQGLQGFLLDTMYGPFVDLSHTKSFGGNAFTIDTRPSFIPDSRDNHIIADATTYNFAKWFNIKHALIERFPTTKKGSAHFSIYDIERTANNYIGKCIQQLVLAMDTDAILEIELEPFLTMFTVSPEDLVAFHRKNPFQGAFNYETVLHSLAFLHTEINQTPHNDTLPHVDDIIVEQLRVEIVFYHETLGLCTSVNQIIERLIAEVGLIHQMSVAMADGAAASNLLIDCVVNEDPTEQFLSAAPSAILTSLQDNDQYVEVHDKNTNTIRKGFVYTLPNFMKHTFFDAILCSIAVQQNTPYIIEYLQSVGFEDVTVERRTNEHNVRQNVWLVRAVKAYITN